MGVSSNISIDHPTIANAEQEIIFQGRVLDKSHKIARYRGIVYCMECGAFSEKKVRTLSHKCRMKPANSQMARQLKSIMAGEFPIPGRDWPQPLNSEAPNNIVLRVGGGHKLKLIFLSQKNYGHYLSIIRRAWTEPWGQCSMT